MAKQTINQGAAPTGAGGDTFRSGSAKLQANDDEIYSQLGATAQGVLPAALPINKGGTGATTAADARVNLGLGDAATRMVGETGGNLMQVGAFGLGLLAKEDTNLSSNRVTGFYSVGNTVLNDDTVNPIGTNHVMLHMTRRPQVSLNIGHSVQIASGVLSTSNPKFRTAADSGVYTRWFDFYTQRNTTVDSNGFIKRASPIVQLFADKIEFNDEAQLQEITFEKLGVGDYLVKGSSGFAQEGWYVETPKDANGNLLVAVVYEQLENGDISVKTYDYMLNNKGRIVADTETPLDIPENRWIDLRLQELPQPEIEVTDDPEQ